MGENSYIKIKEKMKFLDQKNILKQKEKIREYLK